MPRPQTNNQGTVIVDLGLADDELLVMCPDGQLEQFTIEPGTGEKIEQAAKRWFKKHMKKTAFNIGQIEWRNHSRDLAGP